jgi:OmcA/MtrC family decaheme c-type cytochrome
MLTGGLGYSYNVSSAPPLVQTDLPAYPYNTDGKKQGGLSVPADNVWKVATGYAGRRAIVDNARCNACHGALGVAPSFHAGQRNDGPTCAFCHTPNRTSNGWSAGSKYFVHAIHATRMRTTPFNWHMSASIPGNQWEAEFPSPLNDCESCHAPKTYDFSLATPNAESNLASIPSQLLTTVGQDSVSSGVTYNYTTQVDRSYFFSPYVDSTTGTNYGLGFSYNAGTNATTAATGTTLVISQITTACAACHDSQSALAHMRLNGGQFYDSRTSALASFGESCLTCHGPGRVASIADVHK